uniref:Claudin n=1 Tax=Sus scrofa TaxID=9823 RepID=A0A4X1TRE9_PIG
MSDGGPEIHGKCSLPSGPSLAPDAPSSADGSPWSASTSPLFNGRLKLQLMGFVVATVGWVLGTTSMALAEWRVWYVNSTSLLSSHLACVGVWRACIFRQGNGLDRAIGCQGYSYFDPYVPMDIHVAQILLPLATVLGLFSKAAIIFALKNMYLSKVQKTCDASAVAGMLSIAASFCILAAVVWNQLSIQTEEGIAFPPSFNL